MKKSPPRSTASRSESVQASAPAVRTILVLLRHGDAGEALAAPERDATRPLTSKGHKQAKRAGKALARMGLLPRDVWTCRLARASETARTALSGAGVSPRVTATAALAPEAAPERILRALVDTPPPPTPTSTSTDATKSKARAAGRRPVGRGSRTPIEPTPLVRWVVGHDPHLVRLAAFAVGASPSSIRLRKGGFAVVAFDVAGFDSQGLVAGAGTMTHLFDPDALRAVTKHRKS